MNALSDRFDEGGAYEQYMGRWSRLVARRFVPALERASGLEWLDVGCGTGAVSAAVLELASPREVVGVDPSAGFVAQATASIDDRRARFLCADAHELPFADASFDVVVSGLCLNFLVEPARAMAEAARVVRPGGLVAAYVWDYAEGMELLRVFWDAARELDPAAAGLDEGRRFPLARERELAALVEREAALTAPVTWPIAVTLSLASFDDYWRPFLGGQGPAPGYVASLADSERQALERRLRERLPGDGPFELRARAWAVRAARR